MGSGYDLINFDSYYYSRYVQVREREKGSFVITVALEEVRLFIKRIQTVMRYLTQKGCLQLHLVVEVYKDYP